MTMRMFQAGDTIRGTYLTVPTGYTIGAAQYPNTEAGWDAAMTEACAKGDKLMALLRDYMTEERAAEVAGRQVAITLRWHIERASVASMDIEVERFPVGGLRAHAEFTTSPTL